MASQPALPFAVVADLRIGRRTPRPEIVAQAARILAATRQTATRDVYGHCADLAATIPHRQTEAGR